jgi:hypothetical protein
VGLAESRGLDGPWKRLRTGNPSGIEPNFIENPIVTRVGRLYVAIYDSIPEDALGDYVPGGSSVGYSCSTDGVLWPRGGRIQVTPGGSGNWCSDVRTPLCLIDEGHGEYTMLYTGASKDARFFPVGLTRLRLRSR